MEISQKLHSLLLNCDWLKYCGTMDKCTYNFDVYVLETQKQALKVIRSIAWENTCLDAQGDLSGYLHLHHNREYNEYWNEEVTIIKENFLPPILEKVKRTIEEKNYSLDIIEDIEYNVLIIMMSNFYSEFYESVFFKNMLEVYLSGHLPCGWMGKYPNGKFMIF